MEQCAQLLIQPIIRPMCLVPTSPICVYQLYFLCVNCPNAALLCTEPISKIENEIKMEIGKQLAPFLHYYGSAGVH